MSYLEMWAVAFGITLGLELLVAAPLLRWRADLRLPAAARRVALVNAITHPVVWFVIPHLELEYTTYLLIAEAWAFVGEAALYRLLSQRLRFTEAALISCAANGASFGFGLLLQWMGWWS